MAKIFISHSSCDKEIIDLFKNKILNGGLGVVDEDIAYTSAVETGVTIGGNIPQYIKDNIANCDFIFFMISENYRTSEVCLNEMGAAWALDKCVKPFIIEDIGFESIGWLYGHNLGAKIDDGERLDELRDTFIEKYGLMTKSVVWNRCKAEFVSLISEHQQSLLLPAVTEIEITEIPELGLLDYWDLCEDEQNILTAIMQNIAVVLTALGHNATKRTDQLNAVDQTPTKTNRAHVKSILIGFAKEMDQLSIVIESDTGSLKEHYEKMIDYAICIKNMSETDNETRIKNRASMTELMNATICARDAICELNTTVEGMQNMQQTFIASKNRLVKNNNTLIEFFDSCLVRIPELLK